MFPVKTTFPWKRTPFNRNISLVFKKTRYLERFFPMFLVKHYFNKFYFLTVWIMSRKPVFFQSYKQDLTLKRNFRCDFSKLKFFMSFYFFTCLGPCLLWKASESVASCAIARLARAFCTALLHESARL